MNSIQAAAFGVQLALIREAGLSNTDASRMAKEAETAIRELFAAPESTRGKTLLYAISTGGQKATWTRITPDTLVEVVNEKIKGRPWLILDVMHFVNVVCETLIARDPADQKSYEKFDARRKAARN